MRSPLPLLLLAAALTACGRPAPAPPIAAAAAADSAGSPAAPVATSPAGEPGCGSAAWVAPLPGVLSESSGLAASRRHPGILWTHNDSGGEPAVYAIDHTGRLVGTVRVTGARNVDWEDIAIGPCPTGDCLYIGDIGDNDGVRNDIGIYRVPEPAPGDARTAPAEHFALAYPDRPRDAEALYVLPDTGIYIVSKGREGPVGLFRLPAGARPGAPVRLAPVQTLSATRSTLDRMVTAADASPDGRWVAVRTYAFLQLYHPDAAGHLSPVLPQPGVTLEDAGEPQGEAVAFGAGDTLWLSSEAGPLPGGSGSLGRVQCRTTGN